MKNLEIMVAMVISSISSAALAGVITFHPENAVYAGSGCPQGSTDITLDEFGDLFVDHHQLALNLRAYGRNAALAGRKSCAIRVPIELPRGYYVRAMEQRLSYSIYKSAHAVASVSTRAAISGDSIAPLTESHPYGSTAYGQNIIVSRHDELADAERKAQYCSPYRSESMMLQINTVISAQRESIADDVIVAAHGGYIGEGFEIEIEPCY